jgi:hypothetical protein
MGVPKMTKPEGGRGPIKVLLNGWRKGMKEGGAVETQEFEDKGHIQEGRNGVNVVNESQDKGHIHEISSTNIASTGAFSEFAT